jgi:hypothetical protein
MKPTLQLLSVLTSVAVFFAVADCVPHEFAS